VPRKKLLVVLALAVLLHLSKAHLVLYGGRPPQTAHLEPAKPRPGLVAATIAAGGGGDWLQPDDHVDVIATFRDSSGQLTARTILENVVVLSGGAETVSLQVLPEESEQLALAAEQGRLTLTVRNGDDLEVASSRGPTTVRTLLETLERRPHVKRVPSGCNLPRGTR
jgi:Flp pilus assembly protein CpaB